MALRDRFDRLEPREQKLVVTFGAVFVVLVVLGIPVALAVTAAGKRAENATMRELISQIEQARPRLEQQEAQRQRVLARYAKPAPALAGFLEQQATAHSIEIPESQDRPAVPLANKRYEERSTKIELQKVGMKNLATFLEAVETAPYPVRVSALTVRKRATEPDSWDVSLSVSAFDRKEAEKKPAPEGSAAPAEGTP